MGEMYTKVPNAPILKLFGARIPIEERQSEGEEGEGREEDKAAAAAKAAEKKAQKVLPCPRCKSMETKFCYFNNYNVNQPRHFCKGCQRYWTAGGALRNVPFGAGRRKSKPPCHVFAAGGSTFGRPDGGLEGVVLVEQWAAHVSAMASRVAKKRNAVSFGQFR